MPSERSSPARGSSSLGTPDAGPPVRFGGSGGFSPRPYPFPPETEALRQICGPFLEQRSEETAEVFGEVAEHALDRDTALKTAKTRLTSAKYLRHSTRGDALAQDVAAECVR